MSCYACAGNVGNVFPAAVSDPGMHHGTCVMHVPWCTPGALTSGFLWSQWRGKRSRHSRRMPIHNFMYLVRGPSSTKGACHHIGNFVDKYTVPTILFQSIIPRLYSGTCIMIRKSLTETHKFHRLPGTVFTKSYSFSLSWKTTCLERLQNLVVALYRFHCIWMLLPMHCNNSNIL